MAQVIYFLIFSLLIVLIHHTVSQPAPLNGCSLAKSGISPTATGAAQYTSVNWVNEPNQCNTLCSMNYGLFGNMGAAPCKAYAFSYSVPLYSTQGDLCYLYTVISNSSGITANGTYNLYTCP
uniref:Uncharacterized protein n=1 Tax=Acrobeloides nanus TaxID=290746 RepID=A0A914DUA8_9BILA